MGGVKWTAAEIGNLKGRIALITGANSGIGFEAARALARCGARVILACRSEERGRAAVERIRNEMPDADAALELLDLASLKDIARFAESLRSDAGRLDVLINNAGVMIPPLSHTEDGFELQFGVNHLGHFALTAHLLDVLDQSGDARVVTVSSVAAKRGRLDLTDPHYRTAPYRRWEAYCRSKLANLVFALELQRRLSDAGSTVRALAAHPGYARTELQKHSWLIHHVVNPLFGQSSEAGAWPLLRAATDSGAPGGAFFGPDGPFELWGHPVLVPAQSSTNREGFGPESAERLWALSEEWTGVRCVPKGRADGPG